MAGSLKGLLGRKQIEKPQDEFLLPAPDPSPLVDPASPATAPAPLVPALSLAATLVEEAAHVDFVLDAIARTAPLVTVPVPPEEQHLLGATVTTQDYLASLADPSPKARRLRDNFERQAIGGCGESPVWPTFLAPDFLHLKESLLSTASALEGQLMSEAKAAQASRTAAPVGNAPVGDEPFGDAAPPATPSAAVSGAASQFLVASRTFRLQFGHSLFTYRANLNSGALEHLITPALHSSTEALRPALKELRQTLVRLKGLLCHAQLLYLLQFGQMRDALLSMLEARLVEELLHVVTGVLEQARRELVSPIVHLLETDLTGVNLPDGTSRSLVSILTDTMAHLTGQYEQVAADLIRKVESQSRMRRAKLQSLAERNVVGRWATHLDELIHTLDQLLQRATLSADVAHQLVDRIRRPAPTEDHPLLTALSEHPQYAALADHPLALRLSPFAGAGAEHALVSFSQQVRSFGADEDR